MKGILFKEEMFSAILKGRKTQTRRVIPKRDLSEDIIMKDEKIQSFLCEARARYKKGEVVYMKEPYCPKELNDEPPGYPVAYLYRTSHTKEDFKFKNKIFMPAKHARYFIKIKDVRVERLQDITEEDAKSEGVKSIGNNFKDYFSGDFFVCLASVSFMSLWQSINGVDSWDKNPWVFVYEFELIK